MAARLDQRGLEPCSRLADRNIVRQHGSAPAHAKRQGDGVHQMSAQVWPRSLPMATQNISSSTYHIKYLDACMEY
jgi:hypothetical protein